MRKSLIWFAIVLFSCKENPYTRLAGKTMGTYYDIQYSADQNYQKEIDSILTSFTAAASTYDSTSELSSFNKKGFLRYKSPHLLKMLTLASQFHNETNGAFEPTLMPLIRAHGFGTSKRILLTNKQTDSLLSFVSFRYITYNDIEMRTLKQGVQLDLSAMGEGYAIDLVSDFLQGKGIENYKVEIGAEMKCRGRNPKGRTWLAGIENPSSPSGTPTILTTTELENEAISTSGNSRKFYVDANGTKRPHIIHPKTGWPVENNLLSATVKDPSAVRADVFATALMVMGLDSARRFIEKNNLEALIVYQDNGKVLSWRTPGFSHLQNRSTANK